MQRWLMKTSVYHLRSNKTVCPLFELNGGVYTAVQISAEILKHLKQVAETQLERSVSKAVIYRACLLQ